MIAVIFAAAIVLAQAAPDAAPPASAAPPSAKAPNNVAGVTVKGEKPSKAAPDPKEVICHKEKVLGSMFPKEVCAQRQEFAQRTREDQKDLRDSLLFRPLKVN